MEKQRLTFLSYSRANKDFALKLAKELKTEGFHVWLDQLDIPPGARWDVEVEKALIESEIFMVIITKASISSNNVLDEIGYAIDNGKRLLPVLLENCTIPLRLRRFQYVDFTDKNYDEGVQSAKELLRDLIAQPAFSEEDLPEKDQHVLARLSTEEQTRKGVLGVEPTSEHIFEGVEQEPYLETDHLFLESKEQESHLEAEETRIKREVAELEKRLQEERTTLERIEALQKAQSKSWLPKKRSRLIGVFGISILAVLLAGYAVIKFISAPTTVTAPTGTLAPKINISTSKTAGPLVPAETSAFWFTPTAAAPVATSLTATEAPSAIPVVIEEVTMTASEPLFTIVDDKGAEMVLVGEGDFTMGSSRGNPDEQPVHTVYMDAFYIDKFEVTNKLYQDCVEQGQCEPPRQSYFFPESPNKIYYGNPQYDNYPVIYVDWNMAKTLCEWRGARLPTEAEWEKAARGTEGNTYPWGKDLSCQRANYQNCVNRTSEVGSYEDGISPYGVHDMTGNVWEWVADWYSNSYYSTSPAKNPHGPITGQARVMRGGSWPRYEVTAYHRNRFAPSYNAFDIGFRCARDVYP